MRRNMAPIGRAKETVMSDETQVHTPGFDSNPTVHDVREQLQDATKREETTSLEAEGYVHGDTPVVPADAEPIPAGDPLDHDTVPDEDQPNR